MLVAYLDETFKKDDSHNLLALVLPADQIKTLESRLDAVVEKACKQHPQISDFVELHGYELSNGEKDWSGVPPRARIRIFKDAVEEICSIPDAALCRGTVDLTAHSPGDAHQWALTFALECTDRVADLADQSIIAICDDVGNKHVYQRMFSTFRKNGTPGYSPSYLESFTDGLHFTPSCYSRPIQAVDLLSYVYRRKFITPYGDHRPRKVIDDCWDLMRPLRNRGLSRKW